MSPDRTRYAATTSSQRPAPTSSAVSDAGPKRPPSTAGRSSSPTTRASRRSMRRGSRRARSGLELQVLVRRRVREALDVVDARLLDPWPNAPEERQFVDRHVHHPVVHDLLDLVQHGLALLPIQLASLALVEVLDLRHDSRRIDAALGHVDFDP